MRKLNCLQEGKEYRLGHGKIIPTGIVITIIVSSNYVEICHNAKTFCLISHLLDYELFDASIGAEKTLTENKKKLFDTKNFGSHHHIIDFLKR